MMKSIIVTNHKGESLEMDLRRPELSGLLPYNMSGIGGSQADINMQDMVGIDGAMFVGSRKQTRNITLSLKMIDMEEGGIEASRRLTYKYFETKKPVRLTFVTAFRSCYIDGYVESNEPTVFTNQEATTISIICPDPYFYDSVGRVPYFFSGIIPTFTFKNINGWPLVKPMIGKINLTTNSIHAFDGLMIGHIDGETNRIFSTTGLELHPEEGEDCYDPDIGFCTYTNGKFVLNKTWMDKHELVSGGQLFPEEGRECYDPDLGYYIYTNNAMVADGDKLGHRGLGFKSLVNSRSSVKTLGDYGFGEITEHTDVKINYEGEVDTGIYITIHALGPAEGISIFNEETLERMDIDDDEFEKITGHPLQVGDEIIICTIVGKKSVQLLRDGHYTNIINCINRDATWLQITKGMNYFTYEAVSGTSNLRVQIDHLIQYEGV